MSLTHSLKTARNIIHLVSSPHWMKCFWPSEVDVHLAIKACQIRDKVFSLVDAKMCYTYNMELYCGNQPEGPFENTNFKPDDVVERLYTPTFGTNRNVTVDNWFMSYPVVRRMTDHNLTMVGSVKNNKRQLQQNLQIQETGECTQHIWISRRTYC